MLTCLHPRAVPFVASLAEHGDATALIAGEQRLSYRELADRVLRIAERLGSADIPLVCAVPLERDLDSVAGYLAVLAAGHVAAVVAPGQESALEEFAPDLRVSRGRVEVLNSAGSAAAPHPDLALLLSTSGSTGSSKLVRLSRQGIQHNAEAIARSLHLRSDDRAITSLPLHYCYGLSILHSHLAVGAAVVLSDAQVSDERFWRTVTEYEVTSIAGVPHSFAMMMHAGLSDRTLPSVRRFTAAGGRLAPALAREIQAVGARAGWDLYVMYGQTEATARMSVLAPSDLAEAPGSVGRALPGGTFQIDQTVAEAAGLPAGTGEVVYRGPNVMLGYATSRWDLTDSRDLDALRTGDLGYLDEAGRLHIVGRRSGFVKIVGKRIDLARLEAIAGEQVREACVVGDDDGIQIAYVTEQAMRPADIVDLLVARTGLPRRSLQAVAMAELPRLSNGKVDRQAVRVQCAEPAQAVLVADDRNASLRDRVLTAFRECLSRPDAAPTDSFVSLGGDSLSFVELSVRLESLVGDLPESWPEQSVDSLVAQADRPRAWAALDTSVLLRAVAAVTILGTHIGMFTLLGGAHTLLAVLGFNLARFGLTAPSRGERARRLARAAAGIAVPAIVWIAIATAVFDAYRWPNLLLINWFAGPRRWDATDQLWFVETAVFSALALAALFASAGVNRWYDARPGVVIGVLLAVALVPRFAVLPFVDGPVRGFLPFAFWLVALGMAAAIARTRTHRIVLSIVAVTAGAGFYGLPWREGYIVLGILALLWAPHVRVPRVLIPVITPIAAASLYIYLVQWQVFVHIPNPLLGFSLSVLAGIAASYVATALQSRGAHCGRALIATVRARARARHPHSDRLLADR